MSEFICGDCMEGMKRFPDGSEKVRTEEDYRRAFAAWADVPWDQRAHEEYREHLIWMVRCTTWRNNESETDV